MKRIHSVLVLTAAGLLAACVLAWFMTNDADSNRAGTPPLAANTEKLSADERLFQTARRMTALAETADEQTLARAALRLADHELDQAYAAALRDATARTAPATGPLQKLADRVARVKTRMTADQALIAKLTKEAEKDEDAADQLELAKAQLALDEDELEDAQEELERQGGDRHTKLERALQEHEAAQHETAQLPKTQVRTTTATLSEQVQAWLTLRDRQKQADTAHAEAAERAASLGRDHDRLETLLNGKPASGPEDEDTGVVLERLHGLSDQRKTLAQLGKRIQDSQQLAEVYQRWGKLFQAQRTGVLHLIFASFAGILAVLLTVLLVDRAVRRSFISQTDRRRLHQLRVIVSIAVQFVGALVILLIIFGVPYQTSTILGLATAGLTVALRDFILAFFGWFALLGRNGLRVGDWVEIEGVGGEVIEIGMLRTVLLEMGNWTNSGHPTGRRVAFVNRFAIEGHYFNFSTKGQWLWDELQVTLPTAGDPYDTAQEIRKIVERDTETEAREAEQDWERVTRQYGVRPFSAKPAVDLRPSVQGLEVSVRYITRAPQRYQVKSRLFEAIVELLHKHAANNMKIS
jgi:small-conductance mechanosensitive channel